jgi:2OG-Fe(II) oxygenase superfamily
MDTSDFATKFAVTNSRLMDVVRSELLEGHESKKSINAELYKLNVYGEAGHTCVTCLSEVLPGQGAFFKPHKDTPRSSNMFGSLVIVFPIQHEGGSLKFRHSGREWIFDSAAVVKGQKDPTIAFAAFYSDIEHEVTPVISGHRVTLTYNLYFSEESSNAMAPIPASSTRETAFNGVLSKLLSDPTFMDKGGFLGFGLQHEYPLDRKAGIRNLVNCLKGSDASIQRVCNELSLETALRVVYEYDDYDKHGRYFVIVDDIVDYSMDGQIDGTPGWEMMQNEGGKRIRVTGPLAKKDRPAVHVEVSPGLVSQSKYEYEDPLDNEEEDYIDVDWVTDLTQFTVAETSAVTYGNEAQIDFVSLYIFYACMGLINGATLRCMVMYAFLYM